MLAATITEKVASKSRVTPARCSIKSSHNSQTMQPQHWAWVDKQMDKQIGKQVDISTDRVADG